MGAAPYHATLPLGHQRPAYGIPAGVSASGPRPNVEHAFDRLNINDTREDKSKAEKSPLPRRVSFKAPKPPSKQYRYYIFTKTTNDWSSADRVQVRDPQDQLAQTVAKVKKGAIDEAFASMSAPRRFHIDRLLKENNLGRRHDEPQWRCVYVEKAYPYRREGAKGQTIQAWKRMDVIIAVELFPPNQAPHWVEDKSGLQDPLWAPRTANVETKKQPAYPGVLPGDPLSQQPLRPEVSPEMLFGQTGGHVAGAPPGFVSHNQGAPLPYPMAPMPPHGPEIVGDHFVSPPGTNVPHGKDIPVMQPLHRHHHHEHPQPQPPAPQHPLHQQPQRSPPLPQDRFDGRRPIPKPIIVQNGPAPHQVHSPGNIEDTSSFDSPIESSFWGEDDRSSNTSYGDHGGYNDDTLRHRGSLPPQRRHSIQKREPAYREHRRNASQNDAHHIQNKGKVDTIIERATRRSPTSPSSPYYPEHRRREVRYGGGPQLHERRPSYDDRQPPRSPRDVDFAERRAEDHMHQSRLRGYTHAGDEWRDRHARREIHPYR